MSFKKSEETRVEVSGYALSHEPSTVLWRIENAFDAMDVEILEDDPGYNAYSDLKRYKVTLVIEEV